jgi:hypothetical protein
LGNPVWPFYAGGPAHRSTLAAISPEPGCGPSASRHTAKPTAWRGVIDFGRRRGFSKDDVDSAIATEPASRVERARILLAYREERWFFAVGQALGGIIRPCSAALTEPLPIVDGGARRSPAPEPTITKTTILDLPRFGGEVRAWDQGIWFDSILSSCFTQFFCSAPGEPFFRPGPHDGCGRRAQRGVKDDPCGRAEGLSLTAASTTAGWRLRLSDFESGSAKVSSTSLLARTAASGGSI